MADLSCWLSEEELAEFTGFQWRKKQQMALAEMGVAFHVNPRGRVLVSRDVVGMKPARPAKPQPDWSALPVPKGKKVA